MTSIRRTLSPANYDRQFPSSSLFQNGSSSAQYSTKSSNSRFRIDVRRLFYGGGGISSPSRRNSWRKALFRCLLFFIIGFLLGILRFDNIDDDIRVHDFSFDNIRKNDVILKAEEEKIDSVRRNDVVSKSEEKFEYQNPRKLKLLIVVTPTYNRALQAYYLNRLGQVLRLVNAPLLWIVVEMSEQSSETGSILRNLGVMYRHLVCHENSTDVKDRGVHQRNVALKHIELHRLDGIVYFADDDNVYSLELFERIRDIRRFGTWPVAMLAQNKNKATLEGPVCNGSQVIGWHTNEKSKRLRRFHVDMSGFAFNSTILWDPKRWKRPFLNPIRQLDTVKEGFQETTFIEQVVEDESQMEGIPHDCRKIMNWHLHLDARGVEYPRGWILQKNLDPVFSID